MEMTSTQLKCHDHVTLDLALSLVCLLYSTLACYFGNLSSLLSFPLSIVPPLRLGVWVPQAKLPAR
jgi:hypothetical protein